MSPLLPDSTSLKSAVAAINALDARIAALESIAAENRDSLRTILSAMHPDPEHPEPTPPVPEEELPPVEEDPMAHDMNRSAKIVHGQHVLVMRLLDKLGGRIPLPEP